MPVGKRQKLHKLGGATTRPHIRHDLIAADGDPEPAEQLDADTAVLRFRGHRSGILDAPYMRNVSGTPARQARTNSN
jgi:hypothetical protein